MTDKKFDPMKTRQERLAALRRLSPSVQEHREKAGEIRDQLRSDREVASDKIEIKSQIEIVPDFHPTQPWLATRMVERAELDHGMTVCEPSAGAGAIADAVRETGLSLHLVLIEKEWKLSQMLIKRGYEHVKCMDFLEHVGIYDRFIANPPFSRLQDAEHVMHMYLLLARRGRIVTIMGDSVWHNSYNKAKEFRAWFEKVGGTREKLPDDAFKLSDANVRSWLVTIDKP